MVAERKGFDVPPIVIGVSGHRDVPADAEAPLRERFAEILDRFKREYPATPVVVLSGLAAGADVLAAEEAFERDVPVIGCLPMPQPEYEKDFTEAETARFRAALSRCWDVVVVGKSTDRKDNYVDVATFIAYYSALLVAFWDGSPGQGPGGTADVVHLRETGLQPTRGGASLISYVPDIGPIFHIVTPRKGQARPQECFDLREIYPKRAGFSPETKKRRFRRNLSPEPAKEEFGEALHNLNRFNGDLAREPVPNTPDRLGAFQLRTDSLANSLQKWTLRSLRGLYVFAVLAGGAQLVLAPPLATTNAVGTGLKVGFLVLAYLGFVFAKRKDYENRYQDYRAIAEALRVQQAWCCAGLRNRLAEASYLQMQQSELQWIRLALRTIYLVSAAYRASPSDSPQHKDCQDWVQGQMRFYEKAARREQKKQQTAGRVMSWLMGFGGALAGLAVFVSLLIPGVSQKEIMFMQQHHIPSPLQHPWSLYPPNVSQVRLGPLVLYQKPLVQWLTYLQTVPLAFFGLIALLLRFYTQQRGYVENARRYELMFAVFDAAQRRLQSGAGDPGEVLSELGHEALSEHADWLILHRERPLHFVAA